MNNTNTTNIINFLKCIPTENMLDSVSKGLMQRGIADLIETNITNYLLNITDTKWTVSPPKSKRSIEDVLIEFNDLVYYIDIKTVDRNAKFSMPNLISIDRLKKLYNNDNNFFILFIIEYEDKEIISTDAMFIENLSFDSIHIQNLGKGQLQIKNSKNTIQPYYGSRTEWLTELRSQAIVYYENLIKKTSILKEEWIATK